MASTVLSKDDVEHYAINSFLYITTLKEKYVKIYKNFISQLKMYANMIKSSFKGLLANPSFASNVITGS